MKFAYLWDWFEYFLKKYAHPNRKLDVKPHSTFFVDGTAQSHAGVGTISTDCLPPSLSTVPPLPSDAEDHVRTSFHPSYPPNITPLNFHAELVVSGQEIEKLPGDGDIFTIRKTARRKKNARLHEIYENVQNWMRGHCLSLVPPSSARNVDGAGPANMLRGSPR